MKELIKIDHNQYGLEETKAKEIQAMFTPLLQRMVELEEEYNFISALEPSKENCAAAKTLRLKYVKVRTDTAHIHKELKAFYLAGGRFVDGWKNAQIMATQGIEEKLLSFEKHFENLEKERKERLAEDRQKQLDQYEAIPCAGLGDMEESAWNMLLSGAKKAYDDRKEAERKAEEARIAAEKKAEDERLAREKAEAEERARIKAENDRLKKEAEERRKAEEVERKAREAKEAAERKAREKAEAEARAKAEAERKAHEAKIKVEREAREKAEAELRAKAEAERKAREEEERRIQAELAKGDADKLKDLLIDLKSLKTKYSFKNKSNITLYTQVGVLLDKVISHIHEKAV